jgi:hypothetical protein
MNSAPLSSLHYRKSKKRRGSRKKTFFLGQEKSGYGFPAHSSCCDRFVKDIHIPFFVIMSSYAPPPPNVYWTNTYFFSGGFAVKVSL